MTFPSTTITSPPQNEAEVIVNEAFETVEHQSVYGKRHAGTTGLYWGYYGGRWGGVSVADNTLTLTASATNYIVVARATGAISVSTSSTNWTNAFAYARVYKIDTSTTAVTSVQDHRAGQDGVHGHVPSSAGRHAVAITAAMMRPSVSGGCATLAAIASAANQPDIVSLDFDPGTEEYAQFTMPMPKSWDEGTFTFKAIWSHAATTTNFAVIWGLQAVAISNDDPIAAAYGTAQTVTDTGGTTDDLYLSPESAAITAAGTPAAEDVLHFRVYRKAADGGDTLAIDARLHAIVLFINTNAETDV